MKTRLHIFAAAMMLLTVAACGQNDATGPSQPAASQDNLQDDAGEDAAATTEEAVSGAGTAAGSQQGTEATVNRVGDTPAATGMATGVITSVDPNARTVTIQHTFRISDATEVQVADPLRALVGARGRRVTVQLSGGGGEPPTATRLTLEDDDE